jgi:hypothetical protein
MICLLVGGTASAETMSAAKFDAYTKSKMMFFDQISKPYGAEWYLEDRRVNWSFLDGICKDGYWSEKAGEICFVYEDKNTPQFWYLKKTTMVGLRVLAVIPRKLTWMKRKIQIRKWSV